MAQQKALFTQGLGIQTNYVNQAQGTLNPFVAAGTGVLPTLQGLITPGASQSALLSQTPGFQFASQYGTKAATNALAASGRGASAGPLATAVSQYNNGLAQNTWQGTVSNLQNFAGLGANSANALASIYGSAGNAALGAGIQAGNSQAQTYGNIGNAQAAGTLGQANALSSGISGVTGAGTNALLYNQLFNGNGSSGLYTPQQIANIGNMQASSLTDAQANAYGIANGLVP